MTITATASDSEVLAEAPGSVVLGNRISVPLWLIAKGIVFNESDPISAGSIGPLIPLANAKGKAMVTYAGLPGDPTVSVNFKLVVIR